MEEKSKNQWLYRHTGEGKRWWIRGAKWVLGRAMALSDYDGDAWGLCFFAGGGGGGVGVCLAGGLHQVHGLRGQFNLVMGGRGWDLCAWTDGRGLIYPGLGLVPLCGLNGPQRASRVGLLARIRQLQTGVFFCAAGGDLVITQWMSKSWSDQLLLTGSMMPKERVCVCFRTISYIVANVEDQEPKQGQRLVPVKQNLMSKVNENEKVNYFVHIVANFKNCSKTLLLRAGCCQTFPSD